jgi:DNA-binding GntR family transcriptional regulator
MEKETKSRGEFPPISRASAITPSEPEPDVGTLSDRAYAILEEAIIRGTLVPGARIKEPALAAEFGISRGSLREAIRRLEGKRLLVRTPRHGVRVSSLSAPQVLEIYELREALEGMACRLATEHMSDAQVEQLQALLNDHRDSGRVGESGYFQSAGDPDFHFFIAKSSGNKRLEELLCGELYHLLRIYRYSSSTTPGRSASSFAEHTNIVEAIRRRDADEAERLMRYHIRRSRENFQRNALGIIGAEHENVRH